nr:ribonuclease H-like domain-containing protein [Tanacetum cinerariifolium]
MSLLLKITPNLATRAIGTPLSSPEGNNVVPLRSDTVGKEYAISTWKDLTQFFPPGRTIKLYNDILIFQQHQGESLSKAWTRFIELLQKDSKPFDTLADLGSCVNIIPLYLFKKLNIGLLEETDHVFRLADGTKSYPIRIVKDVGVHIGRLKLLSDFYIIDMKKDPKTPLLVGRGFLATANAVIYFKKAKISVGEGITSSDGVGARTPYDAKKEFMDFHLPGEWEIARDAKINPFKDVLVFRRMVKFLGAIPINLKRNMWDEKAKAVEEPKEQNVSPIRSGRGKGYMCLNENEANVPKLFKKNDVPRKTRSLTVAEETITYELAKSVSIKEPHTQQQRMSQLRIDSQIDDDVAITLKSLKQKNQPVEGEGSSATHTKYYDNLETDSYAILYSTCSDMSKKSANETDDADGSNIDLTDDNLVRDDDVAWYGTLLDETLVNELTDLMSHLVYTNAQTTSVEHNPKGNPKECFQQHSNLGWFTKKSRSANAMRRTTWFDLLLKSSIDLNKDHILGSSIMAIAKKLTEIIQKDELTITYLKGAGPEKLKLHYKNSVKLEYNVDQLKVAVVSEAQWNNDEGDVSKPRSFECHMSKSSKPHPSFYNNDFYYLVYLSTKEKYTTSLTKHYAERYHVQDVYLGHVIFDNAESVWKELHETYDRIDGSIMFNLLQKINSFKQGGLPISEYYHKLDSLLKEFDILTKLPDYTCATRIKLVDHGKLLKLMQFLMGLDDIYQPIRSNILTREILYEFKDAFLIVSREESHRGIPPTTVKIEKP